MQTGMLVVRRVSLMQWLAPIQPVETFVAESVVIPVAAVNDMVDHGIDVVAHLYIPEDAVYETMQAAPVGDDPYGIVSHLHYLVDETGYQSILRGIVDKAGAVIDTESSICTDIKTSFAVLVDRAGPVVDKTIPGSVAGKKILLCVQAIDADKKV
jgi:hypothetical protein